MAVGCNNGNTSLLELSDSLSVSNKWGNQCSLDYNCDKVICQGKGSREERAVS